MAKLYGGAAAMLALVAAFFAIKRSAALEARRADKIKDLENAENLRRRASTVDQRLREYDDAGWRD
jgi:hypothetical protein|tara:strand:- start:127 stop:324 length:198 start_codon:yes stop_codon:yes gene_type:complete